MPWRAEWRRVVAGPCAHIESARTLLAANENVAVCPSSWAERPYRPILARSWERRGLEAHIEPRRMLLRVLVRARLRDADGWSIVEPEYLELGLDARDMRSSLLAHVSVSVAELAASTAEFSVAALSRNKRTRAVDVKANAGLAWDWDALARNPGIAPEDVLAMRDAGFADFSALSQNPALRMPLVRARPEAPWCWYTLSSRLVSPDDHGLPVVPGALSLNPAFSDDDLAALGIRRMRACARHGFACAPRITSRAVECGLRDAPVNWHVYVRLTDDPTRALQEALDAGQDTAAMCVAALGNAHATLALVAWILALHAGRQRWACLTAAGNELRVDRERARQARAARRGTYPLIVRMCLRRALPTIVARAVYQLTRPPDAARVVRVTEKHALVEFACGMREDRLWIEREDPLCEALLAKK
jgi:hypothetical protein